VLQLPLVIGFEKHGADQPDDALLVREDADHIGPALDLFVEPLERIRNRYEDGGADVRLEPLRFRRMVRPSGTEAPGARSAGRPIYSMSCELALVAGRLCDSPGCAVSADP
jgi:hypothetical protein